MTIATNVLEIANTQGDIQKNNHKKVSGEFVSFEGERWYAIHNTDQMPPFFISVVSDSDHWLFASSWGGLSAGRVSPETALFPYVTVDKIHESTSHTGSKTVIRVDLNGNVQEWEPNNFEHKDRFNVERHLYKNSLGNKLCYIEINTDLQLQFSCTWSTSKEFGFVRECSLQNLTDGSIHVELLDGLQNILPAGTPKFTQTQSSNLVDAYKLNEFDPQTGLAMYTLFSGITDRAEPCESLRATTVFSLGLENSGVLLASDRLASMPSNIPSTPAQVIRGKRGAYLVNCQLELTPKERKSWQIIANTEQSQQQIVALQQSLRDKQRLGEKISESIASGSDRLARIMAASDGFQHTNEEMVSNHYYASVLFNVLRGGIFDDQYMVSSVDFNKTIAQFNKPVFEHNKTFLESLPAKINYWQLLAKIDQNNDQQLTRLGKEYLPITFGRRHGDPSRPWNQFAIRLQDDQGMPLLSYEGNWRDIFQNWEALSTSFPRFVESMIAKFVNASTVDGYNPYRITKEGIDWEVEDPDDPWSYIGYWGDHQIIYLLKFLEQSKQYQPENLAKLLGEPIFAYANVPYRLRDFESTLRDAKNTVDYDDNIAKQIEQRVAQIGADGKLVLDKNGEVYQVNLLEKLLIPLLSKLSNLVPDGGIWLNTQRPEWNDANNALVGQGLSMVTLYYLRRYICFMQELLFKANSTYDISKQVHEWLTRTATSVAGACKTMSRSKFTAQQRMQLLCELGKIASDYRQEVYASQGFSGKQRVEIDEVQKLLSDALSVVDISIQNNVRADGLYHAYNLLDMGTDDSLEVKHLYPMLEGQVAVLSSGALSAQQSIQVIEKLYDSAMFRPDQNTFMLYPDRELPSFLDKNRFSEQQIAGIELVDKMLAKRDERLIQLDVENNYRFHPNITNADALQLLLSELQGEYCAAVDSSREALLELYEATFQHQYFTGRSGGMFGFEGLGCVYWHMVAKLLLAVQESYWHALTQQASQNELSKLKQLYYKVREGIGFNMSPREFGAFPADPYSHTPKHAGAQQPGMTGQVKEEILTRAGELGLKVIEGQLHFNPSLLRECEFIAKTSQFSYLDTNNQWQSILVPENALAFTWCQVPIVYVLSSKHRGVHVEWAEQDATASEQLSLSSEQSEEIINRSGRIRHVIVNLASDDIYQEAN